MLLARSIGVFAVYLSVLASWQAPAGDSCDPHDRGATVELFFAEPAHLLLHVLRFECLWRFGATAVVTTVQVNYRPSIDGSGRRFWLVFVDFEGVDSRPSYLGRLALPLISAPLISR